MWPKPIQEIAEQQLPPIFAIGDPGLGRKVHGTIIKYGFECDSVIETALLSMYGEMGCLDNARKIFDYMPMRDGVSRSSIVSCYVQNRQASEALNMFGKMVTEGVEIDAVSMLSAVEACGELGLWRLGKYLHGFVVRRNIHGKGLIGEEGFGDGDLLKTTSF